MLDDLQARATAARQFVEGLEREREGAAPERIAAIDAELRHARAEAEEARYDLNSEAENENMIIGEQIESAATEAEQAALAQQEQAKDKAPAAPSNVTYRTLYQGARMRMWAGVDNKSVETHIHPDIIAARLSNARMAASEQRKAQEKEQAQRDQAKADEKELKDQKKAAFIFESGQARGLGTADYLKIEADHRRETIRYADNAANQVAHKDAEHAAVQELSESTGIEHYSLEPGVEIEGEIVEAVEVQKECFYVVGVDMGDGTSMRFVIAAGANDYAVGDEIAVTRDPQRGIDIQGADYGYGR